MIWPPREIPSIPLPIINSANAGKLLIFVGAGVSRLLNYPSWGQFADSLLKKLASDNYITFGEIKLLQEFDAKKKLTIAVQLAENLVGNKYLFEFYEEKFKNDDDQNSSPYLILNQLKCPFITTNYDTCLDAYRKTKVKSEGGEERSSGKTAKLEKNKIICSPDKFTDIVPPFKKL